MQKKRKTRRTAAECAAMYGVLTALAMLLSYIETLIPIPVGIPGVKPGLANLVVFAAMYLMTPADAFVISMTRILLVGFTFGNGAALLYSFAGGLLSWLMMSVIQEKEWLPKVGVSVVGGISHNLGQLFAAALVLESGAVFTYFPALLISGSLTGALIGLLGGWIITRLPNSIW